MKKTARRRLVVLALCLVAGLAIVLLWDASGYAYGFATAVDKEHGRIKEMTEEWVFQGKVTDVAENVVTMEIRSRNTPRFLPKEYMPSYHVPIDVEDSTGFEIEYVCRDSQSMIRVGDPVSKVAGTTAVRIGEHDYELVPWD